MKILGIKDSVETKSIEQMEAAAAEHYCQTFCADEDGRYEVHLPWKETSHELNDNNDIAEKRCVSIFLQLMREEKYKDYDAVFSKIGKYQG